MTKAMAAKLEALVREARDLAEPGGKTHALWSLIRLVERFLANPKAYAAAVNTAQGVCCNALTAALHDQLHPPAIPPTITIHESSAGPKHREFVEMEPRERVWILGVVLAHHDANVHGDLTRAVTSLRIAQEFELTCEQVHQLALKLDPTQQYHTQPD